MGDPLLVSVQAADPRRAAEFIRALEMEIERRGAGPALFTIEISPPGGATSGVSVRVEDGVERAASAVLAALGRRRDAVNQEPGSTVYSPEEEEEVRKRLEDLGYM